MKKSNFNKLLLMAILMTGFVFFTSCGDDSVKKEDATEQNMEKETKADEDAAVKEETENKEMNEDADSFTLFDADKNGIVTKDEFIKAHENEFAEKDKNKDGKITKDECGMFDKLNKDNNDFVDKDEFLKGHEEIFALIDTDKNGEMTKEELAAFKTSMKKEAGKMKCGDGKCGK